VDKFTIIITEKEKSQQKKITNTNYSNLGLVMVKMDILIFHDKDALTKIKLY
jgi:hypothetical protein